MAEDLRYSLLGPVRAWRGGQELELGSPQQRLVLAVLLLARGRAVSNEQVMDAVWDQTRPRTALQILRTYVSRLRAVLGTDALRSIGDGYALRGGASDLAELHELYGEGRYAEALALWQGEPLAGLSGLFADSQRARLSEQRLAALQHRLDADLDEGRHAEVVSELTALCAEHPTRERLRGLLMLALYRAGRQAEAIGVYTDTRRLLADELGVDPSPELAELYQRIISADPELGRAPARPAAAHAPITHAPRQLPADSADFTGRACEIEDMVTALRSGETSALVVTAVAGAGGVGKTTLAVHVAHQLAGYYPDGQLFVDLRGWGAEPLEPGTALGSFLRALGLDEAPEDLAERAALYRSVLADRRVLVVLDNASDAGQVRPLMPGSSLCGVIVTSRARLTDLSGARQMNLEVLDPVEALRLLGRIAGEARVAAERPAAMDLVAACGFLPLAIRIAAARLAARPNWSVAGMRDRLSDERRRLAELRAGDLAIEATFTLGYEQLDDTHARAFRLLAVPDGGDLPIAAAAALLGLPEHAAEDVCEGLVDVSMLQSPSLGRYRFHDLLKIYARSRCDDPEVRRAALDRLLDFSLASVCAAMEMIMPGDTRSASAATRSAGMSFADDAAAIGWINEEEQSLLGYVEQAARTPGCDLRQAVVLFDMGIDGVGFDADHARIDRIADLLVGAAEERGDQVSLAIARVTRGLTRVDRNHHDAATADGMASRDLSLEHGDLATYARALNLLALCANERRDRSTAVTCYQQAVETSRSIGDLAYLSTGLGNLARALSAVGRHDEALEAAGEAERIMLDLRDGQDDAHAAYQYGIVLCGAGRPQEAVLKLRTAVTEYARMRMPALQGGALFRTGEAYLAAGMAERALECAEEALTMLVESGDEWGQGMALTVLGQALRELGQPGRSQACLTEALSLFERLSLSEAADVRALLTKLNA
ncbi:BTAD domain-containing putative transcriptional regulator [Nonomuraea spiralis]|uniref:BTAD domain-containing putative transcriptional regulator n=1 Tax=Nonomuraea spiralis TaxID=46182 RepID=A0ABV5ITD5_9ACTN|nr:BTAD domain-containing putative transcriptional regulator [Nonomuraea spiralis]